MEPSLLLVQCVWHSQFGFWHGCIVHNVKNYEVFEWVEINLYMNIVHNVQGIISEDSLFCR